MCVVMTVERWLAIKAELAEGQTMFDRFRGASVYVETDEERVREVAKGLERQGRTVVIELEVTR